MVFRFVRPMALAEACKTLRTSCADAVAAIRHTSAIKMLARRVIRSSSLAVRCLNLDLVLSAITWPAMLVPCLTRCQCSRPPHISASSENRRQSQPVNGFQSPDLGDDLPVSYITCDGMHLRERNGGATTLDESSMLPSCQRKVEMSGFLPSRNVRFQGFLQG